MKRIAKFTPVVTVAVASLWNTNVHAFDRMIHPGQMCRLHSPTLNTSVGNLAYLDRGIRNNNEAGSLHIVCPIIRDNLLENTGLEVRVRVKGNSNRDSIACKLQSFEGDGRLVSDDLQEHSGFQFGEIILSVSTGLEEEVYSSMICEMPVRSELYNYIVTED